MSEPIWLGCPRSHDSGAAWEQLQILLLWCHFSLKECCSCTAFIFAELHKGIQRLQFWRDFAHAKMSEYNLSSVFDFVMLYFFLKSRLNPFLFVTLLSVPPHWSISWDEENIICSLPSFFILSSTSEVVDNIIRVSCAVVVYI